LVWLLTWASAAVTASHGAAEKVMTEVSKFELV
jgi:hypothetical protein